MIFNLKSFKHMSSEPIVRLELRHSQVGSSKEVDVMAILEDDREISVLTLLPDGRFHRCLNVDDDAGFRINKYGQIVECRNL